MQTISRTRQVLAVMAVATALCADRAILATPAPRAASEEIGQIASRLVTRLARNLGRAMPVVLDRPLGRPAASPALAVRPAAACSVVVAPPLSPFQFRLPPPAV